MHPLESRRYVELIFKVDHWMQHRRFPGVVGSNCVQKCTMFMELTFHLAKLNNQESLTNLLIHAISTGTRFSAAVGPLLQINLNQVIQSEQHGQASS